MNLKYYWPIENSNLEEIVSQANFIKKENWTLTTDRFNNSNSAVALNDGYLQLEPRVYFKGDFTIMIWAKTYQLVRESVLFNFTRSSSECVQIKFLGAQKKGYYAFTSNNIIKFFDLITDLQVNVWYHYTISLNGSTAYFYLNGVLEKIGMSISSANVNRTACFIGGFKTRADFDDMRIFDKALTSSEIANEMNNQ